MANIPQFLKTFIATLKPVATSGSYTDLTNKPTISAAGTSGSYTDLTNKPTLGTAAALDVGNSADQILQKTSDNKYPVGDGSNLTNIIASDIAPSIPYSVISAVVDANGRANFMSSASTQLDFNVTVPIKVCYANGSVETNATMTSISTGLANGINYIIKEFGGDPYFTLLQPVEQFEAPASPAAGQLWLDLSVLPYVPKKWNGSSWVTTQFVKLGEVVITTLVIGTPINYALNGFFSGEKTQPYSTGSFSCNLGVAPQNYSVISFELYAITTISGLTVAGKTYPVFGRAVGGDAFAIQPYRKGRNSVDYGTYNVGWYVNGENGDQVSIGGADTRFKLMVTAKRNF